MDKSPKYVWLAEGCTKCKQYVPILTKWAKFPHTFPPPSNGGQNSHLIQCTPSPQKSHQTLDLNPSSHFYTVWQTEWQTHPVTRQSVTTGYIMYIVHSLIWCSLILRFQTGNLREYNISWFLETSFTAISVDYSWPHQSRVELLPIWTTSSNSCQQTTKDSSLQKTRSCNQVNTKLAFIWVYCCQPFHMSQAVQMSVDNQMLTAWQFTLIMDGWHDIKHSRTDAYNHVFLTCLSCFSELSHISTYNW